MRTTIILFFLAACACDVRAGTLLDGYVARAIESNSKVLSIRQKQEGAALAVEEADALFLPKVDFLANYTRADGGRTIDLPIGDLLNPVYGTLNALTGTTAFPTLSNVSEQLNPDNFYDAKFRVSAPLWNADLRYNKQIRSSMAMATDVQAKAVRRDIEREVRVAYYRWMQARQAVRIYESAENLLREQLRITESLLANGSGTRSAVVRTEHALEQLRAQKSTAELSVVTAAAAFNTLLEVPLTTPIDEDTAEVAEVYTLNPTGAMTSEQAFGATEGREEQQQLEYTLKAARSAADMAEAHWEPKLGAQLDLGSQAFDFAFSNKTRYYLFGLGLEWNLFSAGAASRRAEQAQVQAKALELETSYVRKQLALQYYAAVQDMNAALARLSSARSQVASATVLYGDVQAAYRQDKAISLEVIDAYNTLLAARIRESIAALDVLVSREAVRRASSQE